MLFSQPLLCSETFPYNMLVVGSDDPDLYRPSIDQLGLQGRVRFEKASKDVLSFYAAADLYVGPSLEDSFGLPILEAMACGLPVIASSNAGASEMIRDGETGFILGDPRTNLNWRPSFTRFGPRIRYVCPWEKLLLATH